MGKSENKDDERHGFRSGSLRVKQYEAASEG